MAGYYIGEDLKEYIRELEGGFQASAYEDAKGFSIGYGHFIKPGEEYLMEGPITKEQAENFLEEDIKEHQKPWIGNLRDDVSSGMVVAMTSFAYNAGGYSKGIRDATSAVNEGDDEKAIEAMGKYNQSYNPKTGRTEVNPGLVVRRAFEGERARGNTPDWRAYQDENKSSPSSAVTNSNSVSSEYHKFSTFMAKRYSTTGAKGVSFSSSIGSIGDCMSTNAQVLQDLKELNALNQDSGKRENAWLRRIKQEGSGLWAALP